MTNHLVSDETNPEGTSIPVLWWTAERFTDDNLCERIWRYRIEIFQQSNTSNRSSVRYLPYLPCVDQYLFNFSSRLSVLIGQTLRHEPFWATVASLFSVTSGMLPILGSSGRGQSPEQSAKLIRYCSSRYKNDSGIVQSIDEDKVFNPRISKRFEATVMSEPRIQLDNDLESGHDHFR